MSITNLNVGGYKQISASGNVSALPANMLGIFCSSSTAGTVAVYDDPSTGTGTKVVDTFSVAAATWYPLPLSTSKGINIVVGGAAQLTVVFA